MKVFLLSWLRWKSRLAVKARLNKSSGQVRIVYRKRYVDEYGVKRVKNMYWNERGFADMEVYADTYSDTSELIPALSAARRRYIMNMVCEKRIDKAAKEVSRL